MSGPVFGTFDDALKTVNKKMKSATGATATSTVYHTPDGHEGEDAVEAEEADMGTNQNNGESSSTNGAKGKAKGKGKGKGSGKSKDNAGAGTGGNNAGSSTPNVRVSNVSEEELQQAMMRLVVQHDRSIRGDQSDENVCFIMANDHPFCAVLAQYVAEYDDISEKKQQDASSRYEPHPHGKRHRAMLRNFTIRLHQYLKSNAVLYDAMIGDVSDPDSLAEALLTIQDKAQSFDQSMEEVKCTRCYSVKYWCYEEEKSMTKWIMYTKNDVRLQSSLEELMDYNNEMRDYGLYVCKDELPLSKEARLIASKLKPKPKAKRFPLKGKQRPPQGY
eukprot:gnl/MRDRNA2_/MRDRNA2_39356_c0_seq1.p1 gnl/MRDRNA2_/MRDRNA2_39356_c0~~gnl/MRDRNA2_/MRDRNA2_39356_c0_seq1.p1  ORF type:complete len:331 (-),score=75.63 gnl/MRDRNA2_/MRDRNA2_39356_c0_seq1:292-1284(-)